MTKKDYTLLIYNYLNGTITQKSQEELDQWLSVPDNRTQFEEIKSIWELTREDHDIDLNRIQTGKTQLETRIREIVRQESRISRLKRQSNWLVVTFSVTLVLVFIILNTYYTRNHWRPIISNMSSEHQSYVILPDSSEVSLNDSTYITYRESRDLRALTLTGEAFFKVKENRHKPFVIHTGLAQIEVTGTSFAVQSYPGKSFSVILASGEVSVTRGSERIVLNNPDEMAVYDTAFYKKINSNPNLLSWYSRVYQFDKTTLREILKILEKDFRVVFSIEDERLLNCRFSGRFQQKESLETILNVISLSLNLTTQSNGLTYTITGSGCPENEFQ